MSSKMKNSGSGPNQAASARLQSLYMDAPTPEEELEELGQKVEAVLPITVLLSLAILPYVLFGKNYINEAFMACLLSAMI